MFEYCDWSHHQKGSCESFVTIVACRPRPHHAHHMQLGPLVPKGLMCLSALVHLPTIDRPNNHQRRRGPSAQSRGRLFVCWLTMEDPRWGPHRLTGVWGNPHESHVHVARRKLLQMPKLWMHSLVPMTTWNDVVARGVNYKSRVNW